MRWARIFPALVIRALVSAPDLSEIVSSSTDLPIVLVGIAGEQPLWGGLRVAFWIVVGLAWLGAASALAAIARVHGYSFVFSFFLLVLFGPFLVGLSAIVVAGAFLALVWGGLALLSARHARDRGEVPEIALLLSFFLTPIVGLLWIYRSNLLSGSTKQKVTGVPFLSPRAGGSPVGFQPGAGAQTPPASGGINPGELTDRPETETPSKGDLPELSWEDVRSSLDVDVYRAFSAVSSDPDHVRIALERVALIERWKAMGPDLRSDRLVLLKSEDMFPALEHRLRQELGDAAPGRDGRPMENSTWPDPIAETPTLMMASAVGGVFAVSVFLIGWFVLAVNSVAPAGSPVSDSTQAAWRPDLPGYSPRRYREYGDALRKHGDLDEAVWWYRHAAGEGDVPAMYRVGRSYDFGEGVALDDQEAVRWYLRAALGGDAYAPERLKAMYAAGEGVTDLVGKEAFDLHSWAAKRGLTLGQLALGKLYDEGIGVDEDNEQAALWFKKAMAGGDEEAERSLFAMYDRGESLPDSQMLRDKWRYSRTVQKLEAHDGLISDALLSRFLSPDYDLTDLVSSRFDIDGDDKDEIVVVAQVALTGSETEMVQDLLILNFVDGEWILTSSHPVGGSLVGLADPSTIALERGDLTLIASRMAEQDNVCCPSQKAKLFFKVLSDGSLEFERERIL